MTHTSQKRGFTVIELVVVTAISTALAALLLPAVQQSREAARRSACKNNLKQIALAIHNYHDTHACLPPGYVSVKNKNQIGWATFILPFMDQAPLYNELDFDEDWNTTSGMLTIARIVIPGYACPSDSMGGINTRWVVKTEKKDINVAKSNYLANRSVMYKNSKTKFRDITDGTSNTLLAGERETKVGYGGIWIGAHKWSKKEGAYSASSILGNALGSDKKVPYSINSKKTTAHRMNTFSSVHTGGAQFSFCDGHVRFLSEKIDIKIYYALATHNKGDTPGEY